MLFRSMVGTYVMLSNIYAAEGKWGEYANMRKLMRGMGSKKEAGYVPDLDCSIHDQEDAT